MTRLASIALSFVVGALALPACASSGDDSATGDDQDITSGEIGALCGGIAGIRCTPFLHCELSGTHADAAGTCQPGSELGATCGGFAGLRCRDGLACEITAEHPDATGTCQVPSAPVQCMAIPTCDPTDRTVDEACPEKDGCYQRTLCGQTVFCQAKK